jgi:SAM-dependent methyltransferase
MSSPAAIAEFPAAYAEPPPQHPPSLLPANRTLEFVCPLCRGDLAVEGDAYACPACDREYPLLGGIPDFRVFPDPFLSVEDDRERTSRILDVLERHTLPSLLEFYWSLSDITPAELRPKYVQSALHGESRARRLWRLLPEPHGTAPRVLEIGSGTGNFLAVAVAGASVVGTDIAMRWLHVSRRRFLDRGLPVPPLVCCCAEYLPFRDAHFDRVVSAATLEFVRDPEQALGEAARVLRSGGSMLVNTANRYSPACDPYSHLRGVGCLPRRWQSCYVRWRNGACYEHTRPLSLGEFRSLARRHFAQSEIAPADVDEATLRAQPARVRTAVSAYRAATRLPFVRGIAARVAPQWDALLERPCHESREIAVAPSPRQGPTISVVIASAEENGPLIECLEALDRQIDPPDHEILVIECGGSETSETVRSRFPHVCIIKMNSGTPIPRLRAEGIAQARGRIVAITEDHCLPAPDWLKSIADAHAAGHPVVGGEIENACTTTRVDRAAFLCEYGRFIAPLRPGPAGDLAASNVAYDRALLSRFAAEWQDGYHEARLHARLRRAGVKLYCTPRLRVRHKQSFTLRAFLRARFAESRTFAASRVGRWPRIARAAYALATPLIVPLQAARLGWTAFAKRSRAGAFVRAAPPLGAFLIVGAVGEATGALFGAGTAPITEVPSAPSASGRIRGPLRGPR